MAEIRRFPAIVSDNQDPEQLGRLLLEIPGIMGEDDPVHPDWIPPRVGAAGPGVVGFLLLPPVGAATYVEVDAGGAISWVGADFGGKNKIPPDLLTNYPRRSGFSSPVTGRHVVAMDEDSGYLVIVEDDVALAPGARSYLSIGANGTLSLAGARGGLVFLGPDGAVLGGPDGSLLNLPAGGEIQLVHAEGVELLTLGGGLARLSGGTVQISGGLIQLGDGVAPPINPYLLTIPFVADMIAAFGSVAALLQAPGPVTGAPGNVPNLTALVVKLTASQSAGTPYLSNRIFGS